MSKWRVETSGGVYEVESDKEPTQADLDRYLAALTPSRRESVGAPTRENQAGGRETPSMGKPAMSPGTAIDVGLESGIPLLAQVATAPLAETGLTSAVGAGASVLGNTLAQVRRYLAGEQDKMDYGQSAQAALTGAVPFAGPSATAARLTTRPLVKSLVDITANASKAGVIGGAGETVKTLIDEGRLPSLKETVVSSAIPATIAGGAFGLGSLAGHLVTQGERVGELARDYGATTPTPGMLMPGKLAATEQRLVRENPASEVAGKYNRAYSGITEQMQSVAPNPAEGAEIFSAVSPLVGQLSKTEKELAKLNQSAQSATQDARAAAVKAREAQAASNEQASEAARSAAEGASNRALDANLQSALENARTIATNRIAGGAEGLDPATARTLFVEHVAKPVEAAFNEKAAQMYSTVDNLHPGFDASPILAEANKAAVELTGGAPKKLEHALDAVQHILNDPETGNMVSLQALRNARSELLRKVNLQEFGSSMEERLIKGVASSITSEIDRQASSALGDVGGEALRAANKFYRETRPLFDAKGVDVLFNKGTPDEVVRGMISGMEKAGINSDEYKNLQTLISKIGEFNPDLAKASQQHVNDTLKRTILFDASHVNPASRTGELTVDPSALVESLDKLGRVPGTLEALNLGTTVKVAELKRLLARYPEAPKMNRAQWEGLMDSPAFASAAGSSLSTQLAPALAEAQVQAQLVRAANLRAGGKIDRANADFQSALETARSVGANARSVQQRYEAMLKDPVTVAFNNPAIPETGFNAFAKALFDPKANALTNTDVRAMTDALRDSANPANRKILQQLQERYIADRIAQYHSTSATPEILQHPDADAVALFFNPIHPGDATNEIARARALLEPAQMNQLAAFARTAKAVREYETLGAVRVRQGSYDIPVVGELRRGLDAVADFYREGRYNLAAKLLADPNKFSSASVRVGQSGKTISDQIGGAAQGAGRALDASAAP